MSRILRTPSSVKAFLEYILHLDPCSRHNENHNDRLRLTECSRHGAQTYQLAYLDDVYCPLENSISEITFKIQCNYIAVEPLHAPYLGP